MIIIIISILDNFSLISQSDIVSINLMTDTGKYQSAWCHIM